ncbi:MAG: ABC transporter permease, partial [Acidimicrobiales bacterium]
MFKLTVRNLLEKKIRFALTTLSVLVGVTFVVGVFVLTDSLRATFDDLAEDIASCTDLTVRAHQDLGEDFDRSTVPTSLMSEVAAVPGVAEVVPGIGGFNVLVIDGDGDAIIP